MNNQYLVPTNTKRATLIAGILRPAPDAIIAGAGTVATIILLITTSTTGILWTILSLIPMLICVLLVLPIPNYHNTLCVIQSILRFYNERRVYIWRGWCMKNELQNEKQ